MEHLEIPAGTTRSFDLGPGLAGQVAGLRLSAEQPVTAAVRQASVANPAQSDPAWAVASAPLGPDGLWPVATGTDAAAVLLLSNPADTDHEVEVTVGNELGGPGQTATHPVPAGSTLAGEVPGAETVVVRVRAGEDSPVRGALAVTGRLGRVRGLAVLALAASQNSADAVGPVSFDPHAGS